MSDRRCLDVEAHMPHAWTDDTLEWCPGCCDNEPCAFCEEALR